MTQEDKNLLLKDLCARLPYGFTIYRLSDNVNIKISDIDDFAHFLEYLKGEDFKPYLRPISSMTMEEEREYISVARGMGLDNPSVLIDWLIAHHLDFRGLIEKGLAIEAKPEMYKTE